MPRRTMPPDAEEIVGQHWPYDGQYSGAMTISASVAIKELVRYLNNATSHSQALPYAFTAYRTITNTAEAVDGMRQLLGRLIRFAGRQAEDPSLYDDRRSAEYPAAATAASVAMHLELAKLQLVSVCDELQVAASLASHLGNNEQER